MEIRLCWINFLDFHFFMEAVELKTAITELSARMEKIRDWL